MKGFIEVPMVTYNSVNEDMGLPEERVKVNSKVRVKDIVAYREAIAEDDDDVAIVVFCKGGLSFYSPISVEEFEKRFIKIEKIKLPIIQTGDLNKVIVV